MSGSSTEDLQTATLIRARRTFPKPLDLPALLHAVHYELQQLNANGSTSHQSLSLLERLGGIIDRGSDWPSRPLTRDLALASDRRQMRRDHSPQALEPLTEGRQYEMPTMFDGK